MPLFPTPNPSISIDGLHAGSSSTSPALWSTDLRSPRSSLPKGHSPEPRAAANRWGAAACASHSRAGIDNPTRGTRTFPPCSPLWPSHNHCYAPKMSVERGFGRILTRISHTSTNVDALRASSVRAPCTPRSGRRTPWARAAGCRGAGLLEQRGVGPIRTVPVAGANGSFTSINIDEFGSSIYCSLLFRRACIPLLSSY